MLRARKRQTLKDAGEIVRESFGGQWYEVHESESFAPRRQAVALLVEAVECGILAAEIVHLPDNAVAPSKTTVSTADLLEWLKSAAPTRQDSDVPISKDAPIDTCAVFRVMQNLNAAEASITLTGDKTCR